MNGMRGSRRTASPIRLSLNPLLGGDIDGAWWPRTGSLASELPDLIEALHVRLGEIVDININWSATSAVPILDAHVSTAMRNMGWNDERQRIMVLVGRTGCARLLVIPTTTTKALGWMVLRHAADLPTLGEDTDVPEYAVADRVVRAAREQSASSPARTLQTPVVEATAD
ncbi:DUF5994 family protein [Mycobacterium sp. shizuoka-1]|uniref:DUF5994 family protein n=1 Tax=Mycobacterium sp. shizuoka-1 TaxID=2039281 RepID=UPI000C064535|nr:DUF5994 family protein [Mycobacterium sp. shizuoka-1]GAY16467.1 hypothetical protein MSZK_31930 [Mycobacterium sp. shizuoka-1]